MKREPVDAPQAWAARLCLRGRPIRGVRELRVGWREHLGDSLPGRKVSALRTNTRACLQVDEVVDEYHWRSAVAFGVYREINAGPERDRAVRLLLGALSPS